MVAGMAAPPAPKPQPKPQLKVEAHPTPEFMWCQRSDRVFVTIKVSDCADAAVSVAADVLEFRGTGHGMCGQREYELRIEFNQPVVADDVRWFVCGPAVRVRLDKAKPGPYWSGLLKGNRKMVHMKVDWASWLDEDEETEHSAAPNGFDAETMAKALKSSDKDPLYRDEDKFESSTTPDEGEETNSIMIDEGMNSIEDLQVKFKALDYEKAETDKTQKARRKLREDTRKAVLFSEQRERDLRYGRPTRDLTEEEEMLIAGRDGLYERLKAEKLEEKMFWLSKWWHQRRPEKKKIDMAEPLARQAAIDGCKAELSKLREAGGDIGDGKTRRRLERRVFLKAQAAALAKFDEWECEGSAERKVQDREGKKFTARDLAARAVREELCLLLGEEVPDLGGSHALKQFADPSSKKEVQKEQELTTRLKCHTGDTPTEDETDSEDEAGGGAAAAGEAAMPPLEANAAEEEFTLELEENVRPSAETGYEAGGEEEEEELELEDNVRGAGAEEEEEDDELELELEDNTRPAAGGTVV